MRTQFPEAYPVTFRALQAPNPEAPEYPAELLAGELANIPKPFILVLDDYHLIRAPEVQACIARLVEILPGNMHLGLACRFDPSLTLGRFRARGQVSELRGKDLRFTLAETTSFLTRNLSPDISSSGQPGH
jgi:LuxR family transcriptional regulator, maltose regulon positive regulatory protein